MAHIKQVNLDSGSYLIEPTLYATATVSSDGKTYTASFNTNFELVNGVCVQIKCPNKTNTAPTTFNTKNIYYNGEAIASNILKANHTYALVYDGTQWQLVGDIDTNTTYTNGTGLNLNNGEFSVKYGNEAGTAAQGNDPRLSDARTPTSHSHGNITNDGKIGTAGKKKIVIVDTDNAITTGAEMDSSTTNQWLNKTGAWSTPTAAQVGAATSDHNHDTTYLKLDGTNNMSGALHVLGNQSSAWNDKGILFTNGSRIGENTAGGFGIYAKEKLYIKPNSGTASSTADGIIIDGDGLYPLVNNTENLGLSDHKWNTVYATTFSGNATTATAWANARKVYVALGTASMTTTINGGASNATAIGIGVDGKLGIDHGGTNATTAQAAIKNLFTDSTVTVATGDFTDNTVMITSDNSGSTANWYQRAGIKIWNYIKGKADATYAGINALAVADALVYKGVIAGAATDNNNAYGALTPAANCGDTYKVSTAGFINGLRVEVGDMLICTTDNTPAATASEDNIYSTIRNNWNIIQTSEGSVSTSSTFSIDNAIARWDSTSGRIIQNSGITIDDSNNITIPGTIYFGGNTSSGKSILGFSSTYPKYGIWYKDDTNDIMSFSSSGNADSGISADLGIQSGKIYNKGNIIPHTGNNTGSVGGTNGPVYVDGGQIKACTTYANATVAAAGKATNDSDGNAINTTYIKKSLLSTKGDIMYASAANTPARLAIGTAGHFLKATADGPVWSNTTDVAISLTNTTASTTTATGALTVSGGVGVTDRVTAQEINVTRQMKVKTGKVYTTISGSDVQLPAKTSMLFSDGIAFAHPALSPSNDVGWLRVLGSSESDTVFEIATGDDGGTATGEKIVVRQYNTSNAIAKEAVLLDKQTGATSFPTSVTSPSFIGDLTGNVTGNVSGSAGSVAWANVSNRPTKITLTGAVTGNVSLGAGDLSLATTVNHGHGYISSTGQITDTHQIASGDRLIVTDSANATAANKNKLIATTITFDGSTATKALTQKGTWETFNNYSHPTSAGNKHIPSGGSNGQFLKYGGSSGTATWSDLPTASTEAAGIIQIGTEASNAMAGNTNVNNVFQDAITYTDYTNWRPLIWGNSNSGTEGFTPGDSTAGVFSAASLTCQPSTGTIRIMNIKLVGAASSSISYTEGTNTKTMISFIKGNANGHAIKIGGGALTVVGGGESAQSISPSATAEHLYLLADNTIYVEANADTIANRIGFAVNTSGAIVPMKAESANDNKQNIGASDNKWANIYATTFHGALEGNASTASAVAWSGVTGAPGNVTRTTDGFMSKEDKIKLDDMEVIKGTQTGKTGAWTGTSSVITSLYDGLTIKYYLNRDPNGNASLNLTLADGTTTGAIPCYYNSGRLTTHYAVGSVITLTYFSAGSITVNGTATTDNRWIADANYDSGNTNTATRQKVRSTDANYSLLFADPVVGTANNNTSYYTYRNDSIYVNPSTGNVYATAFNGSGASLTSLNASNLSSGTIGNARLPARLQEYHTSASNDTTACGWYYGTSGSPFSKYHTSNTDFMVWTHGYDTNWASEIGTDFRSNRLAVRNKNNGTWNNWRELAGNDDIVNEFSWTSDVNYDSVTNTFTNTRANNNWASQVYSKHGFSDGCYISWKTVDATHHMMIGLNSDPTTNANWTGLDYAWYMQNNGAMDIRESNSTKTPLTGHTTYAAGDDFRIEYNNGQIRYYHNGVCCRTVERAISGQLYLDSSLYNGGTVTDLRFGPITNIGTISIAHGGTGATSAADARTNLGLGSIATYGAATAGTKDTWGLVPVIGASDGVMEVGKYIDFHTTDGNTKDYDVRITAATTGLTISGTTSGTFSGSLTGNADTATTATNLSAAPTITQTGTATVNLAANTTYTLTVGGKSVIFKTPSNANTDTLVNYTLGATTKAYLMASQNAPTSTTTARAAHGDILVYLTATSGQLSAKSYSINDGAATPVEKVHLEWNATDQSLDFVFA